MRIFFTGATGVIGRRAIPRLVADGHDISAVARSDPDRAWLSSIGVFPVKVDLFDRRAVSAAVAGHDAVFHFATAIPTRAKMTKRQAWATNDRLRTEATGFLVDAAIEHRAQRFVQESITFFYADGADRWLDENAPIAPFWDILDSALDAERHVARFAEAGGEAVVLRMSALYGPGDTSAEHVAAVAARRMPVVGSGRNLISHLHIEDSGTAVVAALAAAPGTYNVTDDRPVTFREDIETVAATIGASPPRRIPAWLAKAGAGPAAKLLVLSHRVSNERFKRATGWTPRYPSVLEGWRTVVVTDDVAA